MEPIIVRNKREPLVAYELERARSLPGKVRGIPGLEQAFVARQGAVDQLQVIANRLIAPGCHGGGSVLITGEAGIGKSRLVAEWRARTTPTIRWLEGRSFAYTTALPYGPFLDMLRRFAGISDEDSDKRARNRLNKAIESLLADDREAQTVFAHLLAMRLSRKEASWLARLPARSLRERIFVLAEQLIRNILRDKPLILFMEDMQWTDSSTIELLEHLLPLTVSQPMAIVIVARPEQGSGMAHFAEKLLNDEFRDRHIHIDLEPLSDASSMEMVRELLSLVTLPLWLEALISQKAEGNPFFVEEIIRALIERGALTRAADGWTSTPLLQQVAETIPDTLQGLIMARIDRLPDESKEVVQHAAVIGRTFLYRVLLAIAEHTASLDADLGQLERSELIRERSSQPDVEYVFEHALTQEVAYHSVLMSRRREIHRRVGEAFERIFAGRLAEHYAILAEHFKKGEVMDKSADYYLRAADQASRMFSPVARMLYEQGLEQLDQEPASPEVFRQRIDASIDLARELLQSSTHTPNDLANIANRLDRAEEIANKLQDGAKGGVEDEARLGRVYGWIGRVNSERGEDAIVSQYLDKIQPYAARLLDPELAATLGQLLLRRGRFADVERVLAAALDSLPKERPDWIHANGVLAIARAAGGRYREALEQAEAGVFRARKLGGALPLVVAAQSYLGFVLILGGDWERLKELSKQNFQEALRFKHPAGQRVAETLRCGVARMGDRADARQILNHLNEDHADCETYEGVDIRHGPPHSLHEGWHAVFHAEMDYHLNSYNGQGDLDSAEWRTNEALDIGKRQQDLFTQGLAYRLLGQIKAARQADSRDVNALMRQSREVFDSGGCLLERARTLATWGRIGIKDESQYPDARLYLREAAEIFRRAGLKREQDEVQQFLE
jgi:tetratricopeptide (TPR) repeat protein